MNKIIAGIGGVAVSLVVVGSIAFAIGYGFEMGILTADAGLVAG